MGMRIDEAGHDGVFGKVHHAQARRGRVSYAKDPIFCDEDVGVGRNLPGADVNQVSGVDGESWSLIFLFGLYLLSLYRSCERAEDDREQYALAKPGHSFLPSRRNKKTMVRGVVLTTTNPLVGSLFAREIVIHGAGSGRLVTEHANHADDLAAMHGGMFEHVPQDLPAREVPLNSARELQIQLDLQAAL
jgi:hypothetical protein